MNYVGRVPAPPLHQYVDDIYCLSGIPRHRRLNVPPMPSAHLMINLGAPIRLCDSDPSVPPAVLTDGWFMGVWSRCDGLAHEPSVDRLVWPFIEVPGRRISSDGQLFG